MAAAADRKDDRPAAANTGAGSTRTGSASPSWRDTRSSSTRRSSSVSGALDADADAPGEGTGDRVGLGDSRRFHGVGVDDGVGVCDGDAVSVAVVDDDGVAAADRVVEGVGVLDDDGTGWYSGRPRSATSTTDPTVPGPTGGRSSSGRPSASTNVVRFGPSGAASACSNGPVGSSAKADPKPSFGLSGEYPPMDDDITRVTPRAAWPSPRSHTTHTHAESDEVVDARPRPRPRLRRRSATDCAAAHDTEPATAS
mmetsp:Transcript_3618/g.15054  ORF Transcript_3618/g.15054 Transcript_3618/m.15054 type:complete len:254 (+) Transcript_3618:553-1314(+)